MPIGTKDSVIAALETVRCPNCRGAIEADVERALVCAACEARYPVYDGIPWLYRDVASSRAQWAAKLQRFETTSGAEIQQLQRALKRPDLMPASRKRLKDLLQGTKSRLTEVRRILEPFELTAAEPARTLPKDRVPSKQHVSSYLDTIFRDWSWGEDEVRDAVALVEAQLDGDLTGQRALVLGGGAGRLSYELSHRGEWSSLVQLDINPLLTRVAAMLSRGEKIALTETPRLPSGLDHVCVKHELSHQASGAGACLQFLLGDIFAPPFEEESFDVLLTPWFVDILPEDFRVLACRLNHLLKEGGSWVNFGPLSFESLPVTARYTQEEIAEVLSRAGMDLILSEQRCVSYLHSPHGMQKRNEDILVFKAVKKTRAEAQEEFSFYPPWTSDTTRSVPGLAAWQEMHAQKIFDIQVLSLIDGNNSIDDIVEQLSRKYSLPTDRCRNVVNRFFSSFFEKDDDSR